MTNQLHTAGENHARQLIEAGKINKTAAWSLSSDEDNALLGPNGDDWTAYGSWHLGKDPVENAQTKAAWKYPFGKGGQVYRAALIAIRQRAGQQSDTAIFEAAGKLVALIDGDKKNAFQWRIQSYQATDPATAEILIYGDIGESWLENSVTAQDLVQQLATIPKTAELTVRVNSYGGSVSDGLAIFHALCSHPGPVKTVVDGVAVSSASLIWAAGRERQMAPGSVLMLHAPWGVAMGNAADMRDMAATLDTYANAMATAYAQAMEQPYEDMLSLVSDGAEHWYTSADALAAGFATSIIDYSSTATVPAAAGWQTRFHPPSRIMAHFRNPPMDVETEISQAQAPAALPTPPPTNVVDIEKGILAREQTRRSDVRAIFNRFQSRTGVQPVLDACLDDPAVTVDLARQRLLEYLGQDSQPLAHVIPMQLSMGVSAREKFLDGAKAALLARAGMGPKDAANEFRSYSLYELARASLEQVNIATGRWNRFDVVAQAFTHTQSDFPYILADVANKALLKGYTETPEQLQWVRVIPLSDFKALNLVGLSAFSGLSKIGEGNEYDYGTFSDVHASIQLATYGKLFSISRQSIINDDLQAFTIIPQKMGSAAKRKVGDLVWGILTANAALGDSVALFHANHSNLGAAAAISVANLDLGRSSIAKQKDPSGNAYLNIDPAYLLVPKALQGTAQVIMSAQYDPDTASKLQRPNMVQNMATVISDARLDASSTTAYYLAASPNNPAVDTILLAYLDGNDVPILEQQQGWEVDGVSYKVRIDAAAAVADYRGLWKSAGA
jgi:ATP-dependent protease ClpP protease subunit